jgi:hypothetical protein
MSFPTPDDPDSDILRSVIDHVFMPPKLPQADPGEQAEQKTNVALCNSLIVAARDFLHVLPNSQRTSWMPMIEMMELARRAAKVPFKEADLQRDLSSMAIGGSPI